MPKASLKASLAHTAGDPQAPDLLTHVNIDGIGRFSVSTIFCFVSWNSHSIKPLN